MGCDRTLKMHIWCMLLALEVPAAAFFRLHPHVRYQSWSQPAAEVAIARARPAAPGATHIEHLVVTDARAW